MDRIDLEILACLRLSNGMDMHGIKMCGNNMPSIDDVETHILELIDQNLIQKKESNLYRVTHTAKNLFWKENDGKNNLLRLLKELPLTDKELFKLLGYSETKFNEILHDVVIAELVWIKENTSNGLLYEISPKGANRVNQMSSTKSQITQNFITNIDNVQINNSITVIQNNIEKLIVEVNQKENLTKEQKISIIEKLKLLKDLISTAEPYAKPYLLQALSSLFGQG